MAFRGARDLAEEVVEVEDCRIVRVRRVVRRVGRGIFWGVEVGLVESVRVVWWVDGNWLDELMS